MIEQRVVIPDNSRIVFLSDCHIGHPGFRPDVLDEIIKDIAETPNTYWIGLGDYVEGRPPAHKFYDTSSPLQVGEQFEFFFDRIRPITERCLGMHVGNHEACTIQQTTINPVKSFCADNGVTYLGDVGRTIVKLDRDHEYYIVTAHGAGGGTSIGCNLNKITSWATTTFAGADVVCVGHYHKLVNSVELTPVIRDGGLCDWKEMNVVISGSCLQTYKKGSEGDYVERSLLKPSCLGYADVRFSTKSKPVVSLHPY